MESKKQCSIVQDLLPGYVDRLTKPETTAFVDAHLTECESCRKVCRAMSGVLPPEAVAAEELVKKLQREYRKTLYKRWAVVAVLLLIAAVCLLPFPHRIDTVHAGLEWRISDPDYAEPREVIIKGTYYDFLFFDDQFTGHIIAEGHPVSEGKLTTCTFFKNWNGMPSYASEESPLNALGSLLMPPDGSEILFMIHEKGLWSGDNGLMISAPALTREEAVALANRLADELSAEWLATANFE